MESFYIDGEEGRCSDTARVRERELSNLVTRRWKSNKTSNGRGRARQGGGGGECQPSPS